jgi:hypothetical protein
VFYPGGSLPRIGEMMAFSSTPPPAGRNLREDRLVPQCRRPAKAVILDVWPAPAVVS